LIAALLVGGKQNVDTNTGSSVLGVPTATIGLRKQGRCCESMHFPQSPPHSLLTAAQSPLLPQPM
jgi:hypothetical protein